MNNNENNNRIHPLRRLSDIMLDLPKASLEDINHILNCYKCEEELDHGTLNLKPILIDGVTYHGKYNPQTAASLNARYHELTGKDHPVFIEEQNKALDLLLKDPNELIKNDSYLPTQIETLKRLKDNLSDSKSEMDIIIGNNHPFLKLHKIMLDLPKANLEDINQILNYYKCEEELDHGTLNLKPILIDGVTYHGKYNPQTAASLNAKYHELTGKDHPVFIEEQNKALDLLLKDPNELIKNDSYLPIQIENLEMLKNSLSNNSLKKMEMVTDYSKHVLSRFNSIIDNLESATLDDITQLLNYYNGKPVLVDGIAHHPFNDPKTADQLNKRFFELTGENHPVFVREVPMVIDDLLKDREILEDIGAYSATYFESLISIKDTIASFVDKKEETKNNTQFKAGVNDAHTQEKKMTFITNVKATIENDEYRKQGVTIVEPIPGISIEEFAESIVGKNYVGNFNNFKIDGRVFQNGVQVVEAYKKHIEDSKKKFLQEREKQREVDKNLRNQQVIVANMNNNDIKIMETNMGNTSSEEEYNNDRRI